LKAEYCRKTVNIDNKNKKNKERNMNIQHNYAWFLELVLEVEHIC